MQRHLADSQVVEAFNNIDFGRLFNSAEPADAPDRSGLPVAGDDATAETGGADVRLGVNIVGFDGSKGPGALGPEPAAIGAAGRRR
ncbi:hypothetical protein ACIQNU_32870 [Streptomyces sp. NPDC091292]|uniref:hypothetical protein n=1 Tax=Streptomyces sp. NPDC091292 TaxID=3365991 RepID=UPI0038064878